MRFFVIMLTLMLTLSFLVGTAMAGSPFKRLCLKAMGMTTKTVEKEVNVIGKGIKKTTDVVIEEVKDVGKAATGKGSVEDVLVKPVRGATAVAGEAAYGVLNAPIEAAQEVTEEDVK